MRTVELEVMEFNELDDKAKERAREWYREGQDYPYWQDCMKSLERFCGEFGVRITDYQVGSYSPSYMTTNAENAHFRNRKITEFKRDFMPTGYCLDCDIWESFYDTWRESGSALKAFNQAIDMGIRAIVHDMEYLLSDESVDEMMQVNGYEFYPNGKIYH